MPALLGWWRAAGPPGLPRQEKRGGSGTGRHRVAAPPAVGAGTGTEGTGHQHHPPPPPPDAGASPDEDAAPTSSSSGSNAMSKAAAPGSVLGVADILSGARHWGFLLKALTVHSASLAAQLATRPLQPLQDRLQRQLAGMEAVQQACRQLQVDSLAELQDLMNCIILSEHVYKIVDHSTDVSVGMINAVKAQFPPHMVTLRSVQWARGHVRHRFLLGESPDALYVSFMGTKLPRDMATNANLFQEEVILDAAMLSSGASADIDSSSGTGGSGHGGGGGNGPALKAHRGFLARARSIPIHSLYQEARAQGKRLVLCGHSLGGAVASLCAIELLQHLPPSLHHTVSCYGFATPALGNDALAARVVECGWDARIRNYLAPDDPIPRLLSFRRQPGGPSAEKAAAATADGMGAAMDRVAAEAAAAAEEAERSAAGVAASSVSGRGRQVAGADAARARPAAAVGLALALPVQAGANNIQAAPKLASSAAAASGPHQRLQRIASHVAGGGPRPAQQEQEQHQEQPQPELVVAVGSGSNRSSRGSSGGSAGMQRSASAPNLLPAATSSFGSTRGSGASSSRLGVLARSASSADVAAATSAAVTSAILQQQPEQQQATDVGESNGTGSSSESSRKPGRHPWLRPQRLAAAAAHRSGLQAVVERAAHVSGSAARLVALPLSVPRAPQYLPLGRQLYILPGSVSGTEPVHGSQAGAVPATPAAPLPAPPPMARLPWAVPFWRKQAPPVGAAAAAAEGSSSGSSSLDDDDNVDVAAAATLSGAAVSGSAGTADGEDAGPAAAAGKKKRRALFEAHRMATYRNRLLGICQGSLEGHLLLRSLPMLPNLPRPGDVAASELLAPAMFPLRATATLEPAPGAALAQAAASAAAAASSGTQKRGAGVVHTAGAAQEQPQQRQHAAKQLPASAAEDVLAATVAAEASGSTTGAPAPGRRALRFWPVGFLAGLLARGRQHQHEPPIELFIRVEGRGLANVTHAWIEGIPPAAPAAATSSASSTGTGTGTTGTASGTSSGGTSSVGGMAAAEVTILQQPEAALLPAGIREQRPQLPVVSQVSSFVSWLAVTLGWVALLRQLQPAGRSDYLLARVRLPAAAVHSARAAQENSLLSSMTDGPLLHGLHLGPRLYLRLQSDFAVHSLPLDIRAAADLEAPRHQRWQWPWRRQGHLPALQHAPQEVQAQAQRRRQWWEWPAAGSSVAAGSQ